VIDQTASKRVKERNKRKSLESRKKNKQKKSGPVDRAFLKGSGLQATGNRQQATKLI
jgi:hypothetical protein